MCEPLILQTDINGINNLFCKLCTLLIHLSSEVDRLDIEVKNIAKKKYHHVYIVLLLYYFIAIWCSLLYRIYYVKMLQSNINNLFFKLFKLRVRLILEVEKLDDIITLTVKNN